MLISCPTSPSPISSPERPWSGSRCGRLGGPRGDVSGTQGALHRWYSAARRERADQPLVDGNTDVLPPLPELWSPLRYAQSQRRRRAMTKWFLRRWIDKFECTWSYDASYLRDVLDADPRALLALS